MKLDVSGASGRILAKTFHIAPGRGNKKPLASRPRQMIVSFQDLFDSASLKEYLGLWGVQYEVQFNGISMRRGKGRSLC